MIIWVLCFVCKILLDWKVCRDFLVFFWLCIFECDVIKIWDVMLDIIFLMIVKLEVYGEILNCVRRIVNCNFFYEGFMCWLMVWKYGSNVFSFFGSV